MKVPEYFKWCSLDPNYANKIVRIVWTFFSFITKKNIMRLRKECVYNSWNLLYLRLNTSDLIGLVITSLTWDEPLVRPARSPITNVPAVNAYQTDESTAKARLAPCTLAATAFSPAAVALDQPREIRRWTDYAIRANFERDTSYRK